MTFGTLSFGELAVDGFFVISGYLITKSMVEGRSLVAFSVNRIARIVPGFWVAFWLSVLVLGPFVTTEYVYTPGLLLENFGRSLILSMPRVPGAFDPTPIHHLNGALWTIAWEFLCYIGVAAMGLLGLLKVRWRYLVLSGTIGLLGLAAFIHGRWLPVWEIGSAVRFASVFMVGAVYYLFRDKVVFTNLGALAACVVLLGLMFVPRVAEGALAVLGGYLIFWFAFAVKQLPTSRLRHDISYGLYLYGWPTGALLVWLNPGGNPWIIGIATLIVAASFGLLSWIVVEGPAMDRAKKWLADRRSR